MRYLVDEAADLAAEGIPIFPLAARRKTPCTSHGVKDATTDPAAVRAFWSRFPSANIGAATGVVFDALDVDGPEGEQTLATLAAAYGSLPRTTEQKTGRGRQLLFAADPRLRNSAGKLGLGLDVRATGGYIVVPPSIHPSGRRYTWTVRDGFAPWPAWLLEALLPKDPDPSPAPPASPTRVGRYGLGALNSAAARVASAPEGTRNSTLNGEAHALGQLVAGGELEEADAEAVLVGAALAAGLPETEARKTTASGLRAGQTKPRTAPPPKAPRAIEPQVLPADEPTGKESAAQVLIRIGEQNAFLFHDERETAHAAIGPDDARRIVSTKSDVFTKFLCGRYYRQTGKGANGEAVATARNVLASKALFEGPRHTLYNRFAWFEGALWIDLADSHRRAARVTEHGWTIEQPPILFRSFKRQAPLPEPREGGDLRRLLDFVNVASEEDGTLALTWTALAPLGDVPRPILALHGPQGGGKSTGAKMLRRLTDPSAAGTNSFSNKDEELALAFETNAVPYFDNLTHISARQAELLCQAVTGGGFSKRELFTDSDEVVYDFRRAILVTGINVPTVAPDLLDRFLLIQLERVTREQRRTEGALWRAFDDAAPALFGGLLGALSGAMARHPRIVNEGRQLERMADWSLWGLALAESIGCTPDDFLAAYQKNVGRQTEEVLEGDPVARAIRELVAKDGGFEGTSSGLFALLKQRAGDEARTEGWPKRADGLARRLNVLQSTLADVGIGIARSRSATPDRTKTISIGPVTSRMYPGNASKASNASSAPAGLDALDALDAKNATCGASVSLFPEEEVA